ncbi:lasso peptide biosynthesis PqqD family chaperone [Paenibacillus oenotherae]|uniref:Lasso peptide biosynthesis PqqD family chaperone n=1 Tax=Paenibacillus oenotherae TaxID=1435645 RepID=A0ABS7DC60_9BACL|nr:lasso peptide biosynthesis PqqD family chaperone [Paenibacillus oenotherae]MBW7476738.1 lasso peptide biosynthesis PqqD family chaperone [Paenibacillus oenotherae]
MMANGTLTMGHIIAQTKGNLVSNMDNDKVLMSINSGKYYNLGGIGGKIWELIETPVSVEEIVAALTVEYEVGTAECSSQVLAFLHNLLQEQLIEANVGAGIHSK